MLSTARVALFIALFLAAVTAVAAFAQLPPSQKLSAEDARPMTQEIERLRRQLASANDKCSVEFQIARTYAAGHQYREAVDWLEKVVDSHFGFDPSRDVLFEKLRSTKEFQSLLHKMQTGTPRVSNSRSLAIIPETDLFPENFAYDPVSKTFFIGSTYQDEIVRCAQQLTCEPFVPPHQDGLGFVLGLKMDQRSKTLWTTSNTNGDASLRQYSLSSGKLVGTYPVSGTHLFNDVAIASNGDVFVTDTKAAAVYKYLRSRNALKQVAPQHSFIAANGIALSEDERTLFVSAFGDGIATVDLASESVRPLPHPPDVCLGYIDGLYFWKGSLIAIQNGPMLPRIVRFTLSHDASEIIAMDVLERRNPLFDGLTTGCLVGDQFYYIANSQIDRVAGGQIQQNARLVPLQVLTIDLSRNGNRRSHVGG